MRRYTFFLLTSILILSGCTEEIDKSARYVFKEVTITDYLQKHEEYTQYTELLKIVPVSERSKSSVFQLLTARGNYTVFAPTNEAIQNYLQQLTDKEFISAPSWEAFTDSFKLDSIRKVIVYNSIIDSGDDEEAMQTFDFPEKSNGEFPQANLYDLKLTVFYPEKSPDSIYINRTCAINSRNRDIPAINGYIHQMESVIAPEEITMAGILTKYIQGDQQGFLVMAKLCDACGLMDTLSKIRDERYEKLYQSGLIREKVPANGMASVETGYSYTPEHRKYGFTIFAEPDEFWEEQLGKPAQEISPADVQQWVAQQGYYPEFQATTNYRDYNNLLYQWTTYHIIGWKCAPNRLIFHYCEFGYDYRYSKNYTIPVMEYYTTMGKRRLLKLYESPEAGGIYLNRFPIIDNKRRGTGHEIGCDADKVGNRIFTDDPTMESHSGINGYLYSIDKPLAYSQQVRDNLGKQRIRMDAMSWFQEAMNNDIRCIPLSDPIHGWVHFPDDLEYKYLENFSINEGSTFVYCNGYGHNWGSYCADEMKCVGRWELVFRLPPFPTGGTWEIRYRVLSNGNRGVAQIYFGTDPNNLPVADIPVDLTMGGEDPRTGWRADTDDDDYNAETDKQMHAKGFLKGEKAIDRLNAALNSRVNSSSNIVRHVIVRQTMDPDKTYYIKFKSVLDRTTAEFYMDGLEFCPKAVYDNPNEPEDIW